MGLSSAFSTAITGLRANSDGLDTIGNNLANVNTTSFKASRNEFATNFYNTVSIGLPAGTPPAGTNPKQFGQGVNIRSIGVDFRPGAPNITGINTDLFIQGSGFFVTDAGNAAGGVNPQFTRDGSFRLDSNNELVTGNGFKVLGFGLGSNPEEFVVQNDNRDINSLVELPIKLGQQSIAAQTETVFVEGNLNAAGEIATQVTIQRSADGLYDGSAAPVATAGGGSVDIAVNSNVVTSLALNTAFLSDLDVGSIVLIAGEFHEVASITDDFNLTLTANHAAGAVALGYTVPVGATTATTLEDTVVSKVIDSTGTAGVVTGALQSLFTNESGGNAFTSTTSLTPNGGDSFDLIYTPRKGDPRTLEPARLTLRGNIAVDVDAVPISYATTLDDLMNFINGSLGINAQDLKTVVRDGFDANPGDRLGFGTTQAGVTESVNLQFMEFEGNLGTESDFRISMTDFRLEQTPSNVSPNSTFLPANGFSGFQFSLDFNRTQDADGIEIAANGESSFMQWTVFDSLGKPVIMQGTAYLQGRGLPSALLPNNPGNNRTRWSFLFESPDQTAIGDNDGPGIDEIVDVLGPVDLARIDTTVPLTVLVPPLTAASPIPTLKTSFDRDIPGNGFVGASPSNGLGPSLTLVFDENGKRIDNLTTGLPITVKRETDNGSKQDLEFTFDFDSLSSLASVNSRLSVFDQDGSPAGTLVDFAFADDGTIMGAFDNGEVRPLGQIALARFTNTNGLLQGSNNIFQNGVNSGDPVIHKPGEAPVGTVMAGALELSNVDIAVQFVDLLNLSNAFNANSRTIATTQELFATLLQLPRT